MDPRGSKRAICLHRGEGGDAISLREMETVAIRMFKMTQRGVRQLESSAAVDPSAD